MILKKPQRKKFIEVKSGLRAAQWSGPSRHILQLVVNLKFQKLRSIVLLKDRGNFLMPAELWQNIVFQHLLIFINSYRTINKHKDQAVVLFLKCSTSWFWTIDGSLRALLEDFHNQQLCWWTTLLVWWVASSDPCWRLVFVSLKADLKSVHTRQHVQIDHFHISANMNDFGHNRFNRIVFD